MHDEIDNSETGAGPRWGRWLGLLLFLVVWFGPAPAELPAAAQRLAAIATLMAVWWVTNAWPIAVTSLLPLVLFPVLGVQSSKLVAGAYFSDSSCLYLGGFIIALGIERWGLHRRLALLTVSVLGSSPKRIVLGFLLATFTLSMWMSNTATTLVMLPIAMSLLASLSEIAVSNSPRPRLGGEGQGEGASAPSDEQYGSFSAASEVKADEGGVADANEGKGSSGEVGRGTSSPLSLTLSPGAGARGPDQGSIVDPQMEKLSTAVLLGIAYAASIGGLTTLVGTPTNIVFGDLFQKSFPEAPRVSAGEWMAVWVPFGLTFLIFCWLLLSWGLKPSSQAGKVEPSFFRDRLRQLGPMQAGERIMAGLFLTTALLWMFRIDFRVSDSFHIHGWGDWVIDGLKAWRVSAKPHDLTDWVSDATVGMAVALLMFFIRVPMKDQPSKPLMDWKTASKLPWDILLLFGGGFALADAFRSTGLAEWAGAEFARHSAHQPAWVLVLAVCLILVFMTEFTTNVATVNAVLPILALAAVGLGVDPRLLMIPATISASCGFMLPIGTPPNAIVFGTGKVSAAQMAKYGLVMNLVGVALTVLATMYLLAPQQGIDFRTMPAWATEAVQP